MHHIHRRRWAGLASSSLLLLGGWGCGGAPSVTGRQDQATVKGTVMVNGKPATTGAVVFDATNSQRPSITPSRGAIGKDGTYEVKAYVGPNRVSLAGPELLKLSPILQRERMMFDVQSGDNTFAIDVPSKK